MWTPFVRETDEAPAPGSCGDEHHGWPAPLPLFDGAVKMPLPTSHRLASPAPRVSGKVALRRGRIVLHLGEAKRMNDNESKLVLAYVEAAVALKDATTAVDAILSR